jgi:hypothetical protein
LHLYDRTVREVSEVAPAFVAWVHPIGRQRGRS